METFTDRQIIDRTLEIIKRYNPNIEIEFDSIDSTGIGIKLRIDTTRLKFSGPKSESRCADYLLGYASGIVKGMEYQLNHFKP